MSRIATAYAGDPLVYPVRNGCLTNDIEFQEQIEPRRPVIGLEILEEAHAKSWVERTFAPLHRQNRTHPLGQSIEPRNAGNVALFVRTQVVGIRVQRKVTA